MATQRFYPRQKDYIKELNYLAGLVDLAQGDKGWSPQIVTVIDGARVVLQIDDWIGGSGTKPAAGQFLGDGELVTDIGDAVDVRGGPGGPGPSNILTIGTVTEGPASATITGATPAQVLNLTIPKGNTGAAATVAVGTVTTGAAGSNAAVSNSGTSDAAVFNFTIPRGDTGEDGPPNVLTIGTVTEGPADATITGTSPNQVLNLVIPKGARGDDGTDGSDGADGAAATITVGTVTTGAPGTGATVTNVGTSSAAVFDITIPRGDPGAGSGDVASVNGVMPDGGGNVELDPSDIGAVEEAPSNGKDHARKDGAWVEIEPGVSSWNDLTDKPAVIAAGATQADARTAIGAGTSSFSGAYDDLTSKPTLGTAAALNVSTSGDASSGEVVKGNDSRLTDSRAPSGAAGGVLSGTYPNPTFAVDMATQDELDAVSTLASAKLSDAPSNGKTYGRKNAAWAEITQGSSAIVRSARTSNTALTTTDRGNLIDITSGTFTQTAVAAATLTSGWFVYLRNSGTGVVTFDPNGSETIDGFTTRAIYPGETRTILCDGSTFRSILYSGRPMLVVCDEKPPGQPGGTPGWPYTRTLNTVRTNTIHGASLSSSQVTLPAGTYSIFAAAPANNTNVAEHRATLYNVTSSTTIMEGTTGSTTGTGAPGSDGNNTHSFLFGQFTLSTTSAIEVRHLCSGNYGRPANQGSVEVYTQVQIERLE